jgi:hypothetical protein
MNIPMASKLAPCATCLPALCHFCSNSIQLAPLASRNGNIFAFLPVFLVSAIFCIDKKDSYTLQFVKLMELRFWGSFSVSASLIGIDFETF